MIALFFSMLIYVLVNISEPRGSGNMVSLTRKVWCYPVQFSTPCPQLPVVEYLVENAKDQTHLRFQGETVTINTPYLHKLVSLVKYLLQFIRLYIILTDYIG